MIRLILLFIIAPALYGCTEVEGDRILGRDMAAAHPAFRAVADATDFGPAPLAGVQRVFRHYEIERFARQHGIALQITDQREACFERKTLVLTEDLLRASGVDLPVLEFSHSRLPIGKAEFRREDLASNGMWRGRWLYGENRSVPIWARVRAPGGKTPLSVKPEIERGDTVRVEVSSRGVLLAFDASAESSGRRGEAVTVRNPANGQRFRALVEAPGKVGVRK